MKNFITISCLLALFGGCGSVKDGFVVKEWSNNMRELGVYPVFPPREDLYVGDIYVTYEGTSNPNSARSSEFQTLGLQLASLDLTIALKAHYAARPEFPASSASAPANLGVFYPPSTQVRLKTVAFPFFLRATATGADIGALVPIDALPLKAGLGLNSVKSASVSVSSAESYSLPWMQIANALVDSEGKFAISGPGHGPNSAETLALLKGVAFSEGEKVPASVDVVVISEVFYARSFDVTMHMSNDFALSAAGSLPSTAEFGAAAASAAATAASNAAANSSASPASAAASAAQAAIAAAGIASAESAKLQVLQDRAKNLAPLTPGISVGVTQSATGDIGLRRAYDRPIAIGYRGVRLRVDLVSGKIIALKPGDVALFKNNVSTDRTKN